MERHCYELSGFRFALTADCPPAGIPFWSLYPALRSGPGPCDAEWNVKQVSAGGSPMYVLSDEQGMVHETDDPVKLLEHLEWTVLLALLKAQDHFLQLHAAGLVKDDRGLLLVGPSGSGKSTQALNLMLGGWRCLSDEIVLINPGGPDGNPYSNRVWPFPRSFHAKAATLRLFPELSYLDTVNGFADSSGKRRFDPSVIREDWVAKPARPTWLVFPSYSPGNSPAGGEALTPIGETEALSMLIEQTINLTSFGESGIEVLISLVNSCACYRLNTRDVRLARAQFSELADVHCAREVSASP
ncbi:MAG: hypothetical protein WAV13_06925 [Thermodesulfovibrionales bacterium]